MRQKDRTHKKVCIQLAPIEFFHLEPSSGKVAQLHSKLSQLKDTVAQLKETVTQLKETVTQLKETAAALQFLCSSSTVPLSCARVSFSHFSEHELDRSQTKHQSNMQHSSLAIGLAIARLPSRHIHMCCSF